MIRRKRGKTAQEKPENCGCCANKNAGRQQERNASSIDGTGDGKKKREKITRYYMRTVGQFKYVGITIIIYCQAEERARRRDYLRVCVWQRRRAAGGLQLKLCAKAGKLHAAPSTP